MAVFYKKVPTDSSRFKHKEIVITTAETVDRIQVPNQVVLCNGCNSNIFPADGYLVYLGKRELAQDRPYDIFCKSCLDNYFPKAKEV